MGTPRWEPLSGQHENRWGAFLLGSGEKEDFFFLTVSFKALIRVLSPRTDSMVGHVEAHHGLSVRQHSHFAIARGQTQDLNKC